MSKEKRRVPKLRFPGFTEDWEQCKLDELTISIGDGLHGTPKYDENGSYYFINGNNLVDSKVSVTAETKKVAFEALSNDDRRLDSTSILMSINGTIGTLARYNNENIMLGKSVAYITPKNINRDFLFYQLQGNVIQSYFYKNLTGTTIKNLGLGTIKNAIVMSTLSEEESKIGQFFYKLDQFITLHQRKLDNLKLKKKALLQKLFPKNGERYPELRFSGFTDAWEQRKLIDIAKTFIGLVTTMTENYRDSGTLLIRNSDIKEGQFLFSENPIHLDEEFAEKNKTRRLQIGDVVTVHTGDIGTSAVIEEKEAGAIGFATINTRTDKSILNPYFLATYFNTEKHKCYANSVSTGDGRSNYNIKDFNKLVISVPTLDEQERISVLINDINIIITLHQRKLDHLKLQKKALLQQMFV